MNTIPLSFNRLSLPESQIGELSADSPDDLKGEPWPHRLTDADVLLQVIPAGGERGDQKSRAVPMWPFTADERMRGWLSCSLAWLDRQRALVGRGAPARGACQAARRSYRW